MASIKVLLWDKANKEGLFPIAIRIIKDRKPSYIYVGHYIQKEQWDDVEKRVKKNHPNSGRLNKLIAAKIAEASATLLDLEVAKNDTSSKAIKRTIRSAQQASFFQQADIYIGNLKKNGKFNRESADKPRIKHFAEFIKEVDGRDDIPFADISVNLLNKYRAWLKQNYSHSEQTVTDHLGMIRTVFNQGIEANVADRKYYPFGRTKILIKIPKSIKIGLLPEEVKKLEEIELPPLLDDARNKWLVSFYFAGMRISDVLRLKWSEFQNDRLYYRMGKNSKSDSFKTPEKALLILKKYKRKDCRYDLVFPDLEHVKDIKDSYETQQAISKANSSIHGRLKKVAKLAGIEKRLSAHIARHTFGNIAGDKIPIQMLQKLYRHSSITTTIGYQSNFIYKDTDDALNAVVDF